MTEHKEIRHTYTQPTAVWNAKIYAELIYTLASQIYRSNVVELTKKCDIGMTEKVHKRAAKLIISLKRLFYSERLKQLQLPTLKSRRLRGDTIEVFKNGT